MKLNIHSVETFGTVDGPGVRYILFVQGCPLRCAYCHNPDTWNLSDGTSKEIDEIFEEILRYNSFLSGGVTVSGGEPLLYARELKHLFKKLKEKGIHTCIDTSGFINITDDVKELLEVTDLVLLDIKVVDNAKHKNLTQVSNTKIFEFADFLESINKPMWIRHVLVPTINDTDEDLQSLKKFIDSKNNVEKVELLPYHELGLFKWEELGLDYKLKGINPPTTESISKAKEILNIK